MSAFFSVLNFVRDTGRRLFENVISNVFFNEDYDPTFLEERDEAEAMAEANLVEEKQADAIEAARARQVYLAEQEEKAREIDHQFRIREQEARQALIIEQERAANILRMQNDAAEAALRAQIQSRESKEAEEKEREVKKPERVALDWVKSMKAALKKYVPPPPAPFLEESEDEEEEKEEEAPIKKKKKRLLSSDDEEEESEEEAPIKKKKKRLLSSDDEEEEKEREEKDEEESEEEAPIKKKKKRLLSSDDEEEEKEREEKEDNSERLLARYREAGYSDDQIELILAGDSVHDGLEIADNDEDDIDTLVERVLNNFIEDKVVDGDMYSLYHFWTEGGATYRVPLIYPEAVVDEIISKILNISGGRKVMLSMFFPAKGVRWEFPINNKGSTSGVGDYGPYHLRKLLTGENILDPSDLIAVGSDTVEEIGDNEYVTDYFLRIVNTKRKFKGKAGAYFNKVSVFPVSLRRYQIYTEEELHAICSDPIQEVNARREFKDQKDERSLEIKAKIKEFLKEAQVGMIYPGDKDAFAEVFANMVEAGYEEFAGFDAESLFPKQVKTQAEQEEDELKQQTHVGQFSEEETKAHRQIRESAKVPEPLAIRLYRECILDQCIHESKHCVQFSLEELGVTREEMGKCTSLCANITKEYVSNTDIGKIAKTLGRYITVRKYVDAKKIEARPYGEPDDEPLELANYNSHYFIFEETPFTEGAFKNEQTFKAALANHSLFLNSGKRVNSLYLIKKLNLFGQFKHSLALQAYTTEQNVTRDRTLGKDSNMRPKKRVDFLSNLANDVRIFNEISESEQQESDEKKTKMAMLSEQIHKLREELTSGFLSNSIRKKKQYYLELCEARIQHLINPVVQEKKEEDPEEEKAEEAHIRSKFLEIQLATLSKTDTHDPEFEKLATYVMNNLPEELKEEMSETIARMRKAGRNIVKRQPKKSVKKPKKSLKPIRIRVKSKFKERKSFEGDLNGPKKVYFAMDTETGKDSESGNTEHKCLYAAFAEIGHDDSYTLVRKRAGVASTSYTCLHKIREYVDKKYRPEGKGKRPEIVIYCHNLKYDYTVMTDDGVVFNNVLPKQSQIYSAGVGLKSYRLKFTDSYKLITMPLSDFASSFNLGSSKMEAIAYDYYTTQRSETKEEVTLGEYANYLNYPDVKLAYPIGCVTLEQQQEHINKLKSAAAVTLANALYENIIESGCYNPRSARILMKKHGVESLKEIRDISELKIRPWDYYEYYLRRDVLTLSNGLTKFRAETLATLGKDAFNYMTISSLAMSVFKSLKLPGSNETLHAYNGVYMVGGLLKKYIGEAIYGGRVLVGKDYAGKLLTEEIQALDMVGLYSAAIERLEKEGMGAPLGPPKIIENVSKFKGPWINKAGHYKKRSILDYYIVTVKITAVNKKDDIPTICVRGKDSLDYVNDGEEQIMRVDSITLEDMVRKHHIEYEIIDGIYWDEGFSTDISKIIVAIFKLRLASKDKKSKTFSEARANLLKLLMNSAYGKTIMKSITTASHMKLDPDVDDWIYRNFDRLKRIEKLPNGNNLVTVNKLDEDFTFPHIGCLILSISKRMMNEIFMVMVAHKIPLYYCDTDSFHFPMKHYQKLRLEYTNAYQLELIGKNLGQAHPDFTLQYTECFTDSRTGLDYAKTASAENVIATQAVYYGKKVYCERMEGDTLELKDEAGVVIKPSERIYGFNYRMKGFNREAIQFECEKKFGGDMIAFYEHICQNKISIDNVVFGGKPRFKYVPHQNVYSAVKDIRRIGGKYAPVKHIEIKIKQT